MAATAETRQFQTETKQLLDLMIHSIYTNKEIFLRELISNASDAIDKLKFEALTRKEKINEDLHIRLVPDAKARTLEIIDTGIGMSRDEVISHIGTIAKSGTKELMSSLKGKDKKHLADLIGQFGVGFYSAFMVADKVDLVTRRFGEEGATRWSSTGDGEYTIGDAKRDSHGTTITIHLKPVDTENGLEDFAQVWTLSNIVKKYSDFISYPIKMQQESTVPETDSEGKPADGKTKTVVEDRTLNSMKPIWEKTKSQVTDEEYQEFYKHISHDWNEPLETIPLKVEGRMEYRALLFIPGRAPFDMYYRDYKAGLQLYVKRVMIMENCDELLPPWLRFVKGVVESADLPLNISREILQQDRHITAIRKRLVTKVIDVLKELKEKQNEKYITFWKEFGTAIKEGITSDFENRKELEELLIFRSTHDKEKLHGLKDYVARMPKDQKEIYFICGESADQLESSPHLEAFRKKGYEVILFTDPVDELVSQHLTEYDSKPLRSAAKADINLHDEGEKEAAEKSLKEKEEQFKDLFGAIQETLKEHISEVKVSSRLVDSPACLVGNAFDISAQLEKILRRSGADAPKSKKILEVNPEHPILQGMKEIHAKDAADPRLAEFSRLLLGYACIAEGAEVPDAALFNRGLADLLKRNLV